MVNGQCDRLCNNSRQMQHSVLFQHEGASTSYQRSEFGYWHRDKHSSLLVRCFKISKTRGMSVVTPEISVSTRVTTSTLWQSSHKALDSPRHRIPRVGSLLRCAVIENAVVNSSLLAGSALTAQSFPNSAVILWEAGVRSEGTNTSERRIPMRT
jgi:hypothetical protein